MDLSEENRAKNLVQAAVEREVQLRTMRDREQVSLRISREGPAEVRGSGAALGVERVGQRPGRQHRERGGRDSGDSDQKTPQQQKEETRVLHRGHGGCKTLVISVSVPDP